MVQIGRLRECASVKGSEIQEQSQSSFRQAPLRTVDVDEIPHVRWVESGLVAARQVLEELEEVVQAAHDVVLAEEEPP